MTALRLRYLEGGRVQHATEIRKRGNDIMHGKMTKDEESRRILENARGIVEHLFCNLEGSATLGRAQIA